MSSQKVIVAKMQEVWSKLNNQWNDEVAQAFHYQYVTKLTETIEDFEDSCAGLCNISYELGKELQLIEQTLINK